jgi:hypothetical protein
MRNSIKKSITLTLTDEELMELLRIILDEDEKEALRFLQKHFKDKARAVLEGEGHCKPSFEMRGQ